MFRLKDIVTLVENQLGWNEASALLLESSLGDDVSPTSWGRITPLSRNRQVRSPAATRSRVGASSQRRGGWCSSGHRRVHQVSVSCACPLYACPTTSVRWSTAFAHSTVLASSATGPAGPGGGRRRRDSAERHRASHEGRAARRRRQRGSEERTVHVALPSLPSTVRHASALVDDRLGERGGRARGAHLELRQDKRRRRWRWRRRGY